MLKALVGTKVQVYVPGTYVAPGEPNRIVERVLRYDGEFYIKYKGMELPVRMEEHKEYLVVAAQTSELVTDENQQTSSVPQEDKPGAEELHRKTSEQSDKPGVPAQSKIYPFERFAQRKVRREAIKPLIHEIHNIYNLNSKQARNLAEYFVGGIPP